MQFLHPEILWALSAVTIPIIVHLFNFRKFRRVKFSNVAFLNEIKQQTQSKSRIKHLLILIARMLAITAVVFAFAQPFFPKEDTAVSDDAQAVSIFIDNSFSMEAENADGQLLELAKNKALEIVEVYAPTDQFQLLTCDFEGRHQRLVNQEEVIEWIEEVQISPQARPLSEVMLRQRDALATSENARKSAYILSDLQRSTHDVEAIRPDSTVAVRMVPSAVENAANVYIDSVWFDTPVRQLNQSERLNIRLRNTAEIGLENIPIKLTIDGQQKALGSFAVQPGLVTDTALYFSHSEPGFKQARVSIDDHPIVFDDDFYLSYRVARQLKVLELTGSEAGGYFEKVFADDPYYTYKRIAANQVDYSELADQNLLLLNQLGRISSGLENELLAFLDAGGSVALVPAENADLTSYSRLLAAIGAAPIAGRQASETKVASINLDHPLYRGIFEAMPSNVDLPKARIWYGRTPDSRSGEQRLLDLQNGQPFFSRIPRGEGHLYWIASPLSPAGGSFAQHAFFVTSALRMAEFSQPSSPLYYTIGAESAITLRNQQAPGDQVFRMQHAGNNLEFLPENRRVASSTELFPRQQELVAGNYHITLGAEKVGVASFNYSRSESALDTYSKGGFREALDAANLGAFSILDGDLETLRKQVAELDSGFQMWYSFIILALIFLAIEILLIKFWPR